MIVTDIQELHKKSAHAIEEEIGSIAESLSAHIPSGAYGLSAPQIGIPKRVFLCNLSTGSFVFVNPEITWHSTDKIPSTEGCLSLPDITRTISRYSQIKVKCSRVIDIKNNIPDAPNLLRFTDLDAFIVQHETDHLDGILIVDHSEVLTHDQKFIQNMQKRQEKIKQSRSAEKEYKNFSVQQTKKLSEKEKKKLKRDERRYKRKDRLSVQREEFQKVVQEGLVKPSESS